MPKFPLSLFILFILLCFMPCIMQAQNSKRGITPQDSSRKEALDLGTIFSSDTITITVSVSACFGGEEYALSLIRLRSNYAFAFTDKHGKDKTERSGSILPSSLEYIKEVFEKGIYIGNNNTCTTSSYITATGRKRKVAFIDGRCSPTDDSFKRLKQIIMPGE
jgi:hypothetical protein